MNTTSLIKRVSAGVGICIVLSLPLVVTSEGVFNVGYADPVGIPTAGVGHTGKDVFVGKKYSDEKLAEWMVADLTEAEAIVDRCSPALLPAKTKAAFISFAFNVGQGRKNVKDGFCTLKSGKQPTFLRKAWAGDLEGSCNGLLAWDKAKGKRLRGLTKRRKAERDLCLEGVREKNGQ